MQLITLNIIKLFLAFITIIIGFTLISCCSSDYIYVKVKKSALMPDTYELDRDSLIVGGIRICNLAQRYYYKPVVAGGGGHSFTGFFIPPHFVKTDYGEYALSSVQHSMIMVSGKGLLTGFDEINPMEVEFTITSKGISTAIIN